MLFTYIFTYYVVCSSDRHLGLLWCNIVLMKRFLPLLMLTGLLFGQFYLSPGLQIGISTKGNLFLSAQVTFGYFDYDIPAIGVTTGLRWYKVQNKWEKYRYNDLQIWPVYLGIGFGQMHDKDGNKSFRFKTGVGFFGYLTYDYTTSFDIAKHNIGLIGVLPLAPTFTIEGAL